MKIKNILKAGAFAVCAAAVAAPLTGCSSSKSDKTADEATEQLTDTIAVASKFTDGLYTPAVEQGKTYPIIVVSGTDAEKTAEVFVSDDFQKETPAYVYCGTDVDATISANAVDTDRVYSVGQAPETDIYAASLIVNSAAPKELTNRKFIYFSTDADHVNAIQDALRGSRVNYTYAEWGANLPVERQSELAATMLEKGAPVNIFQFEKGTVTDADAATVAVSIQSVRNWILAQKK